MNASVIILPFLVFSISQCSFDRSVSIEELNQYLSAPTHGITKEKETNLLRFQCKYMPVDLLAYQEVKRTQATNTDSIKVLYSSSHTFILNLEPKKENLSGSVMNLGVSNRHEYKQRSIEMNFRMGERFQLRIGDRTLSPSVVEMVNTYDLTKDRDLYIVFPDQENTPKEFTEDLELIYYDDLYETGIHHFRFKKDDLNQIPSLQP